MADTRINALSTASSSASDDFVPIDGTTNGTRKLSAYSPSFGGNATVGGTLTVSGSGDSTLTGPISWGTTTPANAVLLYKNSNTKYGNGVTSGSLNNFVPSGDNKHSWGYMSNSDGTTYTELVKLTANTGVLAVLGTTASTTTSSGALVVGNGTSGGLGVGGSITLGGGVNIAGSASDPLPAGTSGVWTASGSGLRINSAGYTFASLTGTSVSDAKWTLNATTASSSVSTGALVVSGGVGADALNVGTFYGMVDGVTAPGTTSGYAKIYVDAADGDLKVKFGDGTVKTIATDS